MKKTKVYINIPAKAIAGGVESLFQLADAINNDDNYTTTITTALAGKAPLASAALTGVPTAPTAAADTDTTQIATTAFAKAEADAERLNQKKNQTANFKRVP